MLPNPLTAFPVDLRLLRCAAPLSARGLLLRAHADESRKVALQILQAVMLVVAQHLVFHGRVMLVCVRFAAHSEVVPMHMQTISSCVCTIPYSCLTAQPYVSPH